MIEDIYSSLKEGDIVRTHFIDRTKAKKGFFDVFYKKDTNSYRFCLVIQKVTARDKSNVKHYFLLVAYGTSQDIKIPSEQDEIILASEEEIKMSKLKYKTKWIFSPSNVALLPIDDNFFCLENIKKGNLTRRKMKDFNNIINKEEFKNIKEEIKKSKNRKMVEYEKWNDKELNINKNRDNYKFD